ncbi:putative ribosome-binding factor A, mitochondrial isoform X2 [Coccinella septempunctata]|nr:putative ribosome-binding factor A, mitochondrial isoform X2 [Coccinella septempunctata]
MFMRYITDLIVNGEYWEKYSNLGIEITKVGISPDYKKLNIFWISKKSGNRNEVLSFLEENSFALRHELSQLKVVGVVPPLGFVEDKHYTQIMELDKRMTQADYGEEYEPLSVSRLKHQLELFCPLEENVKNQLEKLELNKEEEIVDMELPEMPENVLGLHRSDIMKKISHHKKPQSVNSISGDSFMPRKSVENAEDTALSRDAFKTFLHKRQIISQKMKTEDKNYTPDKEYIKGELERSFEEHYDNIEKNLDKFDDYVEEEIDEK